jgi:hypothetical protein
MFLTLHHSGAKNNQTFSANKRILFASKTVKAPDRDLSSQALQSTNGPILPYFFELI